MLGKKGFQAKLFYGFSLEKAVPQDNFYRRLQAAVDLSWVRSWMASRYADIGRPSLDPEVFAKITLIGYLAGIAHDRELMRQVDDRLSLRRYLGYDLDEAVPDHSTLSKTRSLLGQDFCRAILKESVRLCVSAGMVGGVHISGDKSLVKANASLASLEVRLVQETPERFVERVFTENEPPVTAPTEPTSVLSLLDQAGYPTLLPVGAAEASLPLPVRQASPAVELGESENKVGPDDGLPSPHGEPPESGNNKEGAKEKEASGTKEKKPRLSNATQVSRTDPEAELASRPNTPLMLAYAAEFYIDSRAGVIVYAEATKANLPEQATVARAVQEQREMPGVSVAGLSADKGYGKGPLYRALAELGVVGFIPHEKQGNWMSVKGLYQTKDFVYDPERNVYICPAGEELGYQRLDIAWPTAKHVWQAKKETCQGCAKRQSCTTAKTGRSLNLSIYQPDYREMDQRLAGPGARLAAIARRTGPERAFAQAKEEHGLRRAKYRGLEKVRWQVQMTAAAMNLKKYVRWVWRKGAGVGRKRVSSRPSASLFLGFVCYRQS